MFPIQIDRREGGDRRGRLKSASSRHTASRSVRDWFWRISPAHIAPKHQRDNFRGGSARHGKGIDMPSVPEDRTNISQRRDFMHPMGDIKDGQSPISELTDYLVELFHILRRQGRRCLVHNDQTRLPNECLSNLHHLLTLKREIFPPLRRMDVRATDLAQDIPRAFLLSA